MVKFDDRPKEVQVEIVKQKVAKAKIKADEENRFIAGAQFEKQLGFEKDKEKRRAGEFNIARAQERRAAINYQISMFDRIKPFLIWTGIILLIMGPGMGAVMAIIKELNLWYWIGFIVIGILIWRNL